HSDNTAATSSYKSLVLTPWTEANRSVCTIRLGKSTSTRQYYADDEHVDSTISVFFHLYSLCAASIYRPWKNFTSGPEFPKISAFRLYAATCCTHDDMMVPSQEVLDFSTVTPLPSQDRNDGPTLS